MYRWHRRTVRRSEGSTTISQRSKRDRDTEPDLIRNQDILRKISTTKNLPRSFVMGSERSEKNSITTSKATQRGTVTFPVDLYFKRSGRAALNFFFFVCPLRGAGPLSSRGVPVDCLPERTQRRARARGALPAQHRPGQVHLRPTEGELHVIRSWPRAITWRVLQHLRTTFKSVSYTHLTLPTKRIV